MFIEGRFENGTAIEVVQSRIERDEQTGQIVGSVLIDLKVFS